MPEQSKLEGHCNNSCINFFVFGTDGTTKTLCCPYYNSRFPTSQGQKCVNNPATRRKWRARPTYESSVDGVFPGVPLKLENKKKEVKNARNLRKSNK